MNWAIDGIEAKASSDLGAALQPVEREGEAGHLLVDLLDLLEDRRRLGGRHEEPGPALEEAHAEALLGMLEQPADPRSGDVQELGGALDRAGHHHGPDDLDLAQGEIAHGQ